jgi:fatty-acyl-CoA synthase
MTLHYATVIEALADKLGDATAQVAGDQRVSWKEFESRAAKLSGAFEQAGLGKDSRVGILLYNGVEYPEAVLATMKMRGQPINMNYRYVADELLYLIEDSEMSALVYDSSLAPQVAEIKDRAPGLKLFVEVTHGEEPLPGSVSYESVMQISQPADRITRSGEDMFMMYTGGTTGMPKGVMYRVQDITSGMANLLSVVTGGDRVNSVDDIVSRAKILRDAGQSFVSLPASPMMHTAAFTNGTLAIQMMGGTVVSLQGKSFDADEYFATVQREQVNFSVIVGDAFARPMLKALDTAKERGELYDLTSLKLLMSSGVMWSSEVKKAMLDWADISLIDGMGATEGGMGVMISNRQSPPGATASFVKLPDTKLFTEDFKEIPADSTEPGLIAAGGATVPIGYFKDEEKTAKTFKVIDGERFAFTGDWAHYNSDGTITFLGRGSGCINTAGEKVYPEEVEEMLKTMSGIEDCLVVGITDERLGQQVCAVIEPTANVDLEALSVADFCREKMAGYKRPRLVTFAEKVKRAPNGKPDYKWAREQVLAQTALAAA